MSQSRMNGSPNSGLGQLQPETERKLGMFCNRSFAASLRIGFEKLETILRIVREKPDATLGALCAMVIDPEVKLKAALLVNLARDGSREEGGVPLIDFIERLYLEFAKEQRERLLGEKFLEWVGIDAAGMTALIEASEANPALTFAIFLQREGVDLRLTVAAQALAAKGQKAKPFITSARDTPLSKLLDEAYAQFLRAEGLQEEKSDVPELIERQVEEAAQTAEAKKLRNALILIVDDEAQLLTMLERILKGDGFTNFAAAESPEQAFELMGGRWGEVALLLVDFEMPGMNGVEFVRRVRGMGVEVPAIFLTSNFEEGKGIYYSSGDPAISVEGLAQLGVVGGLAKPYSIGPARDAVKRALGIEELK